tara:strand:- start:1263 stop:1757 length:495 start_codon:yes stop_codon:yes gene_type:complete
MNNSKCPVPKEQQPTNEFLELSNSMVFSWPKSNKRLSIVLFSIWIFTFLVFIFISTGSVYFEKSYLKYVLISFFSSLTIPLLIILRLYLGWNHIYKRLTSERVEYEESGWYDGQTWIKPIALREKENLIASLEVKPILKNLIQNASIIFSLLLSGILFFQYTKY